VAGDEILREGELELNGTAFVLRPSFAWSCRERVSESQLSYTSLQGETRVGGGEERSSN